MFDHKPLLFRSENDESHDHALPDRLLQLAFILIMLSSLAEIFSDDFPWLKSRVVRESFLFLFGVMAGALGFCILHARRSRSNKRRSS
jgi:hypothetical protein